MCKRALLVLGQPRMLNDKVEIFEIKTLERSPDAPHLTQDSYRSTAVIPFNSLAPF
jgi:hypothetical protein